MQENKYFCALPKQNWARYLGDRIKQLTKTNNETSTANNNDSLGEVDEKFDKDSGVGFDADCNDDESEQYLNQYDNTSQMYQLE